MTSGYVAFIQDESSAREAMDICCGPNEVNTLEDHECVLWCHVPDGSGGDAGSNGEANDEFESCVGDAALKDELEGLDVEDVFRMIVLDADEYKDEDDVGEAVRASGILAVTLAGLVAGFVMLPGVFGASS